MSETPQRGSVATSTRSMSSRDRPSKKPMTSVQSSVKRSSAFSEGDKESQRLEEEESTKDSTTCVKSVLYQSNFFCYSRCFNFAFVQGQGIWKCGFDQMYLRPGYEHHFVPMGEYVMERGRPLDGVYFLRSNGQRPWSYASYGISVVA